MYDFLMQRTSDGATVLQAIIMTGLLLCVIGFLIAQAKEFKAMWKE